MFCFKHTVASILCKLQRRHYRLGLCVTLYPECVLQLLVRCYSVFVCGRSACVYPDFAPRGSSAAHFPLIFLDLYTRFCAVFSDVEMGLNCSTSPKTVDCLYDIANHAGLVPDASLDSSLAFLLSLNSSVNLEMQYSTLQTAMTRQQRLAFNNDLYTSFGGNATVSYGGVGVVALALSVLFEMLAHHQTHQSTGPGSRSPTPRAAPPDPIRRMFGATEGSDIHSIASEFLKQVPGAANDHDQMVALLGSYEGKLRTTLSNFYGRMVSREKDALTSAGVKQWVNGAALHIHTFLHWKRLTDPSADDDLSLDYLQRVDPLLKAYSEYLQKTVKVFPVKHPGSSGLLVVEPPRNVSHDVLYRPCERRAIEQALAGSLLSAQDPQRAREFFWSSHHSHGALMAQRRHFELTPVAEPQRRIRN